MIDNGSNLNFEVEENSGIYIVKSGKKPIYIGLMLNDNNLLQLGYKTNSLPQFISQDYQKIDVDEGKISLRNIRKTDENKYGFHIQTPTKYIVSPSHVIKERNIGLLLELNQTMTCGRNVDFRMVRKLEGILND